MIIVMCLVILGISWMQISILLERKYWRELTAFILFLIPGVVISILLVSGFPVPNPVRGIKFLVELLLQ